LKLKKVMMEKDYQSEMFLMGIGLFLELRWSYY